MALPGATDEVSQALRGMVSQAALAFTALLPLVNPPGSALVMLGLVGQAPEEIYHKLARRIAFSTAIFLVIIEVLGEALLRFFGISLPVVQLAGGIVVALIGWGILNKVDATPDAEKDVALDPERTLMERTFYPFTFPVTAGPGCLVLMLTLSAHAEHEHKVADLLAHAGNLIAIVAMAFAVYFCYAYAERLTRRVSAQTVQGIARIMGFIVLSIGTQIAWNGAKTLLQSLLHSPR